MSATMRRPMKGGEKEYSDRTMPERSGHRLIAQEEGAQPASNEWLLAGGRLYIDVGSHPEYATAESDDSWEVALRILRGDFEVDRRIRALPPEAGLRQYLVANNLGADTPAVQPGRLTLQGAQGWASHDSHSLQFPPESNLTPTALAHKLAAFQVTLCLIAGNGCFMPTGAGYRFLLSERATLMQRVADSSSTRSKTLFLLRSESLSDPAGHWFRIQVTANDSNLHHTPVWLRFALTDLVMMAALAGELNAPEFPTEKDALAALEVVNSDLTFQQTIPVEWGGQECNLTALRIQRIHHEQVSRFVKRHDLTEYQAALNTWAEILDLIERGNQEALTRHLGWAARLWRAQEYEDKLGRRMTGPEAWAFGVKTMTLYDSKYPKLSPLLSLRRRFIDPAVLAEGQRRDVMPTTGRAALRSLLVQRALELGYRVTINNDWTVHKVNDGTGDVTFKLKDPYSDSHTELEEWLERTAA